MNNNLISQVSKINDKYNVILKGNITISGDVNCLLFAHYCKSVLFYKHFIKVSRDVIKVYKLARRNLRDIKKLIKAAGYKKVWTKGVFSVYGDLRPLAVKAGFGKYGNNGLIVNDKYGTDFLISAVFFKP